MYRKLLAASVMAVVLASTASPSVRADQAVLVDFVGPVAPGETIDWTFELVVAGAGLPNVVYENAESFAVGEMVTATITPVVEPGGFGTAELIGDATLVGTTSDDWNTGEYGEFGEIHFAPRVVLRYAAPSLADLGCADHPGVSFSGHVGVMADFRGDAGTLAHVDPLVNGQGWVGAAVPVEFECPVPESTTPPQGPMPTPPPTDVEGVDPGGPSPVVMVIHGLLGLGTVAGFAWPVRRRRPRS